MSPIDLNPPPKAEVLAYTPGRSMRREAAAIIFAPAQRRVVEAVADLKGKRLLSSRKDGKETAHGQLVAENIVAPYHQHFFNFRLDMHVDGTANSVVELNVNASPVGPANPYRNGFTVAEQLRG